MPVSFRMGGEGMSLIVFGVSTLNRMNGLDVRHVLVGGIIAELVFCKCMHMNLSTN
jgi:hypothetical protein